MNTFIFVRHGQSEGNAGGYIANFDTKLTELGIEQAKATGMALKDKGITKIVCSPMTRAQQTAETIAAELGIALDHIQVIDDLHERRLGEIEGKPKRHDPEWYLGNDETDIGVESRQDVIDRLQRCLKQIVELSRSDSVLVVSHAIAGYYLVEVASGKTRFEDFGPAKELLNAGYVEIDIADHHIDVHDRATI